MRHYLPIAQLTSAILSLKPKLILMVDKELHVCISEANGNINVCLFDPAIAAGEKKAKGYLTNVSEDGLIEAGAEKSLQNVNEAEETSAVVETLDEVVFYTVEGGSCVEVSHRSIMRLLV